MCHFKILFSSRQNGTIPHERTDCSVLSAGRRIMVVRVAGGHVAGVRFPAARLNGGKGGAEHNNANVSDDYAFLFERDGFFLIPFKQECSVGVKKCKRETSVLF